MRTGKFIAVLMGGMIALAACRENIDGPITPTVALTHTPNDTEIALLWTDTPTATATNTRRPTFTSTPTDTPTASGTPTDTPTATLTPSRTPTDTHTPTDTPTATLTASPSSTATDTRTPTATLTASPSSTATDTRTPTATATLTASPSSTATDTRTPTATLTASPSSTPTDTRTPTATLTASPSSTPTDTRTPTATLTPVPTLTFTPNVILSTATRRPTFTTIPVAASPTEAPEIPDAEIGEGEIGGTALPFATVTPIPTLAPVIPPTFTPVFVGGSVPEGDSLLYVNPAGEVTSINGGSIQAVGQVFDVGPQGQMAFFGYDNQLYAHGQQVLLSPSSGFGLAEDMYVRQMDWSPNGRYLAVVFGSRAGPEGVTSAGVWIMDFSSMQSWQVLRDTWDVTSTRVQWAPNSTAVLITANTPSGVMTTFLPLNYDANQEFRRHPYQDSTWAADSASVIVSGQHQQGYYILGRVNLDFDQTYVGYDVSGAGITVTRAAAELPGGQIGFLGATDPAGPFVLYRMTPGSVPTPVSGTIPGPIASWEWNRSRTALLVVTADRQLWIVRTNGSVQNATPANGILNEVHWN